MKDEDGKITKFYLVFWKLYRIDNHRKKRYKGGRLRIFSVENVNLPVHPHGRKEVTYMAYQYWTYDTLHRLCMDAFQKFGFTEREADIIQDVLLTSDLFGIESHGMQRMVRYHKCIEKGMIKIDAKPTVVFETPISAVVDAHDAMA